MIKFLNFFFALFTAYSVNADIIKLSPLFNPPLPQILYNPSYHTSNAPDNNLNWKGKTLPGREQGCDNVIYDPSVGKGNSQFDDSNSLITCNNIAIPHLNIYRQSLNQISNTRTWASDAIGITQQSYGDGNNVKDKLLSGNWGIASVAGLSNTFFRNINDIQPISNYVSGNSIILVTNGVISASNLSGTANYWQRGCVMDIRSPPPIRN